jgi:glyoxylase-like metal-dependent hydrolase (beta-lactamase superfamily II)
LAIHKDEVAMLSDISKNGSKIFGTPIIIKPPEILLEDNKNVQLSFTSFRVIHTSGHTTGSICLLFNDFLITGDTLFAGTIGRTDLDGGSYDDIMAAISKLKKLEPHLIIYPGHGSITTLINELHHNPYLQD